MHRLLPAGAPPPLALIGTTASGKSALAMELARRRGDVELVSVDSMQVYRRMDIGTAKPTPAEQAEVRHHVIDLVEPWETFEVHSFQQAVADALADIAERGRRALLVGGTGLYLQAVVDGFEIPGRFPEVAAELDAEPDTEALHGRLAALDSVAAARMEPSNRRRVLRALEVTLGSGRPFSSYGPGVNARRPSPVRQVGIRVPQPVVADRIERRYRQQLADGFVDEVRSLHEGPPLSRTASQALGYRELLRYLDVVDGRAPSRGPDGDATPTDPVVADADARLGADPDLCAAVDEAVRRTRAFARRQRAWFRRDPRIGWLDAEVDPTSCLDPLLAEAAAHWS